MPDLSSSLSFSTDRHGAEPERLRWAHTQSHTTSSSNSSALLGLPCWDWVSFPSSHSGHWLLLPHPHLTAGHWGVKRPALLSPPVWRKSWVLHQDSIFTSISRPCHSCPAKHHLRRPRLRESGTVLCISNNFPGEASGIKALKVELATSRVTATLFSYVSHLSHFPSLSLLPLSTSEETGHLFRQTTGGTASPR